MGKKKKAVPENETKKERFLRIARPRVNKAIKSIGLIGNCAGGEYEYTPKDVTHIIDALEQAIVQLDEKFKGEGAVDAGFRF